MSQSSSIKYPWIFIKKDWLEYHGGQLLNQIAYSMVLRLHILFPELEFQTQYNFDFSIVYWVTPKRAGWCSNNNHHNTTRCRENQSKAVQKQTITILLVTILSSKITKKPMRNGCLVHVNSKCFILTFRSLLFSITFVIFISKLPKSISNIYFSTVPFKLVSSPKSLLEHKGKNSFALNFTTMSQTAVLCSQYLLFLTFISQILTSFRVPSQLLV